MNKLASHLGRSPLIHSYGYDYDGHPALALRARFAHATAPGKFVRRRSSNLLSQLAPKIQILHAVCGLTLKCKKLHCLGYCIKRPEDDYPVSFSRSCEYLITCPGNC